MLQFKPARALRPYLSLLCVCALALPAALQAQQGGSPLTREQLATSDSRVEQRLPAYLQSRSARFIDWLADGSMLIATRFGDSEQIHRVRLPLGMREQLSFEPAGVLAAGAEPGQSDAFIYLTPDAGGLTTALKLQRPGQTAVAFSDGSLRVGAARWLHDGKRLVFSSSRSAATPGSSGQEREINLLDTTAPAAAARVLAGGSGYRWRLFDVSLDDQRLLLGRESIGETESNDAAPCGTELFIAELSGVAPAAVELPRKPEARGVNKAGAKPAAEVAATVRACSARFAPDGRGLLLAGGDEGSPAVEFAPLRYLDPVSGEIRPLSSEGGHEIDLFDESRDGHFLAYTINDAGMSHLVLVDQLRKLDLNPGAVPPGVITSLQFDPTGKRLALTLESARTPPDVYVLEPETQALTRWTQSELGPIEPSSLTVPALVRFPTWDRTDGQPRMLSAFVYRGVAAPTAAPAPRPVVIVLRSGGGRQFRPGFDALLQYLVNELGFVVVAPNVRGAAGFGRSFGELAQGALRDDAVRDVGSLLVWIGLQHELDFNHIVVWGEGYGSYLALASLGQYGDRLRAGIAAFPPHLGAITNAASIRRPVLLVQGRSDPDAPAYELEQLAGRLRTNGASVEYLGAADEGGRFRHQSNREAYATAVANFLAQSVR